MQIYFVIVMSSICEFGIIISYIYISVYNKNLIFATITTMLFTKQEYSRFEDCLDFRSHQVLCLCFTTFGCCEPPQKSELNANKL